MIAMHRIGAYLPYRRNRAIGAPPCPVPVHPVRRAILHVLSMLGLGMGGVAAVDDDEPMGIG
jgi:hypothetical protein